MATGSEDGGLLPGIDLSVPHSARMYDYYLGGKDNFAADRETAEKSLRSWPGGRTAARENRAFLGRAVRYLAAEAGIRQFLDIGTGLPSANNVHEVAQRISPDAHVVYADNDPIVLAHAEALLASDPAGRTAYIQADLREPGAILAHPTVRATLDFSEPIALMLVAILHFIADGEDPRKIVTTLLSALAPGSYLVASHITDEHDPEGVGGALRAYRAGGVTVEARTAADFGQLAFADLELLDPGVVSVSDWRSDTVSSRPLASEVSCYGAVGRKPLA